jgi:hypothetical protein
MATVTGYTAARIQAIEDQAIVGGTVIAGQLVLTRYNGNTVQAGSVVGPTGPSGPTGDVSLSQLNSAISNVESQISDSGRGIVARSYYNTQQTMGAANLWQNVNGTTVTFTPTVGRAYKFTCHVAFSALEGSGFVTRLVPSDTGSSNNEPNTIVRGGAHATLNNWVVHAHSSAVVIAPAGWNVSKSFKLQAYSTYPNTLIQSDEYGSAAFIVVEDIGVL